MKKIFFILSFILTSAAFANDPKVFVGQYKLVPQTACDLGRGEEKVYVRLSKYMASPLKAIYLRIYGNNATGAIIPVQNGVAPTPGTSPQVHGKVTDTIVVTWKGANSLTTKVTTSRPSVNLKYDTITTMTLLGKKLTISEKTTLNSKTAKCELVKI